MTIANNHFNSARRRFAGQASGLILGFLFGADSLLQVQASTLETMSLQANAWVQVLASGTILIQCPTSEMGQGIMTSLPLLVAEEMDADWNQVKVLQAPASTAFINQVHQKTQGVGGSRSMRGYWLPMRLAGAQARRLLLARAALRLQVPVAELSTHDSKVLHARSGRSMTYGELATQSGSEKVALVQVSDLKPRKQWQLIGKDVARVDVPDKTRGRARFGIDVQLPEMLYASVLFSPVVAYPHPQFAADIGIAAASIDDRDALAVDGVLRVVALDHGVAVIGTSYWATVLGKRQLKVSWQSGKAVENYQSEAVLDEYLRIVRDPQIKGLTRRSGDPDAAFAAGRSVLSAEYLSEHVYHAAMEPMNATALVDVDRVELWSPTQGQLWAQEVAAKAGGTSIDKVQVHTTFLGGGFGLKTEQLANQQAVTLARIMGKPVKVIWSREDDLRNGVYRPATVQRLQAAVDDAGKISAWSVRLVADSVIRRARKFQWEQTKQYDVVVMSGAANIYDIPNKHHEYIHQDRGVPVGYWNANGAGFTNFAAESFMDELAVRAGMDALDYRLMHLKNPRAIAVLKEVASMAGWGCRSLAGRALGLAYYDGGEWNCHAAHIAEVSLDSTSNTIRVHKIWAAVEPGIAVQPKHLMQQVETGILFGLGATLRERITLENGRVQQSNFYDYAVTRIGEVPDIDIRIVAVSEEISGAGQVGLPPVGAAIGNAFAALTGRRIRRLPMLPDVVKQALA